ncbi:3-hydroxyacyl-CoA dehydrogenase NAD-binding domain-containing protein [Spirosoma endophyticum]|uniref:3-hydroxyacyl-CoA dehydrogenase / enoyl-CoA hydratase / 3-hydroxybutyryl-CoA epimerase n=1 Tax=Spirosoma endophyticum TaxID=662367 RepID=A0A1I1PKP5_9BACT|nr:3-hydroxyacyl-CoA dehydrogenase NAD-binding domain-containing protein [Spirosoma endophyticum]SFD10306.1 3-hydroxyacyl-CoA dehydrogenase / enoyl-CoA hydratase / 3-hydroxybutyryl-CoA epimerase [Spirosoma endophyticum]
MVNYTVDQNVAIISWEMTSSPMNVLNDESIPQFEAALQRAFADESVKGIIVTSAKPEFVAGADLKMILRSNDKDPAEMLKVSSELNRIFRSIETSGKPTVAAMNGTALGGGYEICLACHHRVALNNPKTLIGLVEVTIGLLPGAGGTQRLPRMIGIQAALQLLVEGKKVGVKEAKTLGMIDDIAESPAEMIQKARAWIEANPKPIKPWDEIDRKSGKIVGKDNFNVPGGNIQSPVGAQTFAAGTAMLMDKTKGNYPAPLAIMSCVYEGLQVNIDRALAIEGHYFVKVATSKVARNLIQTMFLGMNEANKGASRPKNIPKTDVKKLGVLGAGMMGAGIAYVSAQAGIEVILKDVSSEAAEKGKAYSRGLLEKGVERGKVDPSKVDGILSLIKPTADVADLNGCDLIIEAVFENRELKAQVTKEAEPMLAQNGLAVFGSNTSTLPISGLAEASTKPENFIGIHFFSPVDKMMLVEIIVGKQTSDYALAVAMDYTRKIRKTPIVVNDSRGFYTSRCFGTYSGEGMELLKDGVNPILIENGGKDAGMPVGPLAVTDEVALDLVYKIASQGIKDGVLRDDDTSYQVAKQFVELGRFGKKSKAGFYDYADDRSKKLWAGLRDLFPQADRQPTLDEVKTRLLYRQAIEAVRCFEENVVRTKLDANLGSILGWGFPAYTGGALSFVDFVGVDTFVKTLDRLADTYGERFRPTERLREQVKELIEA